MHGSSPPLLRIETRTPNLNLFNDKARNFSKQTLFYFILLFGGSKATPSLVNRPIAAQGTGFLSPGSTERGTLKAYP